MIWRSRSNAKQSARSVQNAGVLRRNNRSRKTTVLTRPNVGSPRQIRLRTQFVTLLRAFVGYRAYSGGTGMFSEFRRTFLFRLRSGKQFWIGRSAAPMVETVAPHNPRLELE